MCLARKDLVRSLVESFGFIDYIDFNSFIYMHLVFPVIIIIHYTVCNMIDNLQIRFVVITVLCTHVKKKTVYTHIYIINTTIVGKK